MKLAIYFEGSDRARVIDSDGKDPDHVWSIGRRPRDEADPGPNSIVFNDKLVSRHHAVIGYFRAGGSGFFRVMDCQSKNGTWRVDGTRWEQLTPGTWFNLVEGDKLHFGRDSWIVVSYDASGTLGQEDPPTAAVGDAPQTQSGGPWWAVLAQDALDWIQAPGGWLGGLYRLAILLLFLSAIAMVIILQ